MSPWMARARRSSTKLSLFERDVRSVRVSLVGSPSPLGGTRRIKNPNGHHGQESLLRGSRGQEDGFGGGHPQGLSQTRAQIPSRRKPRRQVRGGKVQDALRGQRRSQRSQEAQDLRSARVL